MPDDFGRQFLARLLQAALEGLLGYQCQGLATAFFLGELLDHVATVRGASGSEFSYFSDVGQMTALDEPTRQFT